MGEWASFALGAARPPAEIRITADEGNVVCSMFRLYSLHITVSLYFYLSLAALKSL